MGLGNEETKAQSPSTAEETTDCAFRTHEIKLEPSWKFSMLVAFSSMKVLCRLLGKKSDQRSYLAVNPTSYNDLLSKKCPLVQ